MSNASFISSLDPDGNFIQAERFEQIWISEYVKNQYGQSKLLNDDDYIDYNIWKDQHLADLYKKHLPNTVAIIGKNPNVIFHGGCLSYKSQAEYGIDRCKGCLYFKFDNTKPDLSNNNTHTNH